MPRALVRKWLPGRRPNYLALKSEATRAQRRNVVTLARRAVPYVPHAVKAGELKHVDVVLSLEPMLTTMVPILINPIEKGTEDYNRVGREVEMKSVEIRWSVSPVDSAAALQSNYRMMLVYDSSPDSAGAPSTAELLTASGNATSIELYNHDSKDRFLILYDRTFTQGSYLGNDGSHSLLKPGRLYKKLNLKVAFNSGAGTAATHFQTGSLFWCFTGDRSPVSTGSLMSFNSRVFFTD